MQEKRREKTSVQHKILTVVGIVMCIVLIPMLVINCTLLIKGYTNESEVPTIGSFCPMIVLTDSMKGDGEDNFNSGDLIIVKLAKVEDVKVGEVITFFDPDGTGTSVLTHRVEEINNTDGKITFTTKGDFNNSVDPSPVPAENLIGKYTGTRVPGAGTIAMFMQTTPGLIVCVVLPLGLLVAYDAIRRSMYNKKHSKDKDKLLAELEELRKLKEEATK